jgi:hypothetical protein
MESFIGIALLSCGEKIMGEFIEKVDYIEVSSPFGKRILII